MRNVANFLLFQAGWFACVLGASDGRLWIGPLATLVVLAVHLAFVARPGRRAVELGTIVAATLVGAALDTGLHSLDVLRYPTSGAWSGPLVPPWIVALWALFATMPAHSLSWLAPRPVLAAVLGAVGGPLSFLAGTRFDVVAPGDVPAWTWIALAVEYALATPLLLRLGRVAAGRSDVGEASRDPSAGSPARTVT